MTELNWSELWDETEQRYRVQTRDGRKVRIYTTDARDPDYPVVGEVDNGHPERWIPLRWTIDGSLLREITDASHPDDLAPEPRTVRRWVNVYKMKSGRYWIPVASESKDEAINLIMGDEGEGFVYIATVPVEWEE